jgi:hypothetical protein
VTITDLVPSLSIDNFLAQRDAMIERAHEVRRLLLEISDIADTMPATTTSSSWFRLALNTYPAQRDFASEDGFTPYIKAIDAACWARLLDLSGLRTFMDAAARAAWDENIDKQNVPELTFSNVEATFQELYAVRGDMFERGVVAVFKSLSWDYKTNNPVMFGKRIILRYVYSTWGTGKQRYTSVNHDGTNKLDDRLQQHPRLVTLEITGEAPIETTEVTS